MIITGGRNSGVRLQGLQRAPSQIVAGAVLIAAETAVYSYALLDAGAMTPALSASLVWASYAFMAALAAGIVMVFLGLRELLGARAAAIRMAPTVPPTVGSLAPYLLSLRRYRRFFIASAIAYGVLYAFATSMIVYQPTVDFARVYGTSLPSLQVYPCCGAPLTVPTMTFYLANHIGLYVTPLDLILLFTVAPLVGLNVVLAAFARDNRTGGASKYWLGGLGASVGLFTGCPACAGLFLAGSIGGAGAVAFASALSYYQPEFIAATLPVLVLTMYAVSRSLARRFGQGCPVEPGAP